MATSKPRITVTLTHRQHEILTVISKCSGQAMSAILGEFLEMAVPTLERMAATFQQLKASQNIDKGKVIKALDDAQSALEPIAMAATGQFDLFIGRIDNAIGMADAGIDAARRLPSAAMPEAAPSPPTNRGDTPVDKKGPRTRQDKALKPVRRNVVLKKVEGQSS